MQWTKVVEALNNVIIQVRKDYVIGGLLCGCRSRGCRERENMY